MIGSGRVRGAVAVAALLVLPAAVLPTGAGAQTPAAVPTATTPSPSPSPAYRLRSADDAQDDIFHLEIRADSTRYAEDGPPIQVDTLLAYVGDQERVTVRHTDGGIVAFVVRQLDGPFQPGGPARRAERLEHDEWRVGEVRGIPFAKSSSYSTDDPLADRYAAWFADPMNHLEPGTYEITAQAEYAPQGDAIPRTLVASVIVEVVPGPSTRPFAGALVPRPVEDPDLGSRWSPDGSPAAAITRKGLRYELWLSDDEVAPGEWLQVPP